MNSIAVELLCSSQSSSNIEHFPHYHSIAQKLKMNQRQ
jgi:hypothetical protein